MKVAVIGSGSGFIRLFLLFFCSFFLDYSVSGSVCAAALAAGGIAVTVFDSGRGAGGRMSQRREVMGDGKEVVFDHGAPYFTVTDPEVSALIGGWEARGLIAEWKERFGYFDVKSRIFDVLGEEVVSKKYVGVPGMNSICNELCSGTGVDAKFGTKVAKLEWLDSRYAWSLMGINDQHLGSYDAVVSSDKNIASPRSFVERGQSPPLDVSYSSNLAVLMQEIPVRSCFALMLAFSEPLISTPVKGFSFKNSNILSWAFCDSSKPGRSCMSENRECWVLHSTDEYAKHIISQTGLRKLSDDTLKRVAEDLFQEFCNLGNIPQPIFMKAHRWGSAFPSVINSGSENCLWDQTRKLAICGDFCVSSTVEGAILSGTHAAKKILGTISCL